MAALVSAQSKLLIQILLTDPKISATVFENTNDKEKYKICTIRDNGTIVLGKTSYPFWNQLIGCQDKLPFESFALKVWDALVDSSSGLNNTAIMQGLSQEIVMKSVREKEYDWIVQRLYDCWAHVAQESAGYNTNVLPEGSSVQSQDKRVIIRDPHEVHTDQHTIVLNIDGNKKVIPIIDSVGDTFNLGLEFGITGVRKLY